MARVITGIAPTTELEAINGMLAAIGESPVAQAEIENPSTPDVEMAVNILRDTHREALLEGWRFNVEFGYQLADDGSPYSWTGSDGSTATLLVFEVPSDLLAFEVTQTSRQYPELDVSVRPPRDVTKAEGVRIFYDRAKNRDGFEAKDLENDSLYIEGVFALDFEDCPETFRLFVSKLAAVRFQQSVMGSDKLDRFQQGQVSVAYRALKRDQGKRERYNIFNNASVGGIRGLRYRRVQYAGRSDDRNSARP